MRHFNGILTNYAINEAVSSFDMVEALKKIYPHSERAFFEFIELSHDQQLEEGNGDQDCYKVNNLVLRKYEIM